MGVAWSADFLCPPEVSGEAVQRGVEGALDALSSEISHWDPRSVLSRFNDAPAGEAIALTPSLRTVLERGLALARETQGAFDPAVGALVDLWGFGPPGPIDRPPSQDRIDGARAVSGWSRLELADGVLRQLGGLRLDLSGIGKGYGVDRLAEVLQGFGVRDYLVEIGGELRGAGVKPDGEPWWVQLEAAPGGGGDPIAVALHDLSVATSGDWRRFLEHEGQRLSHTLDPRTGRPVQTSVVAATVLHESCMEADAACTVLSVLPPDEGLAWAQARGLAALLTLHAPEGYAERMTPAFQAMLDD